MTDLAARPLPRRRPDELTASQREVYDAIVGARRGVAISGGLLDEHGGLHGPFNAMLLSPELGGRLQTVGDGVRKHTSLSARVREIAVLVVAAVQDSDFERWAHEQIARNAGFTDDELAALRRIPDEVSAAEWPDPGDLLIVRTSRALAVDGDLDDELYAAATEHLGVEGLFELLTLVGYYALLALQLRVFRVPVP
ncbi:MAG: carboxymuconolactone decarboxylase family protein [Actinomycetota bacterium]